ncbi:MAG: exodeoxyribonuclease VII large subunit [bacterium]
MDGKIYTVSELTSDIRSLLEERFGFVWLTGEISNFKAHSSGHFYFSLKDAGSQIPAVMFRGANRFLKFQMEDGLEVVVNGRLTVYEPRGSYQIVVEYLEPKGWGALQLAFEQLKKKLEAEGLFDPSRKKNLPLIPKKIGIVTSPTGAAIRDLLHVLKRRYPNVEVLLNPVNVQGAEAAPEIARAIDELNGFDDVDLMIVGRGGGSLEDLWAFNTEEVARAIARSRIPIISAVGHEIDTTIADFAADLRAPTPSAAAELAVRVKREMERGVELLKDRLLELVQFKIEELKEKLLFFKSHLKHPRKRLDELLQRVDDLSDRLRLGLINRLARLKGDLAMLQKTLGALSPLAVLERGYSITYRKAAEGGQERLIPLKDAAAVALQEELEIWLARGKLGALVTKRIDR